MLDTPDLWHSEENYGFFQNELFQILQILLALAVYIYIYIYIKFSKSNFGEAYEVKVVLTNLHIITTHQQVLTLTYLSVKKNYQFP